MPDRAGLHDAIRNILEEIRDAPVLPLMPGGRLLLAANQLHDEIHEAPTIVSADDVISALGACAPYLSQETNSRLLALGSALAVLAGQN
jgi:hypothetical protein